MRNRRYQNVMVIESTDKNVWYDQKDRQLTKVTEELCVKYKEGTDDDFADTLRASGKPYHEWVVSIYERGIGWCQVGVTRKEAKANRVAQHMANTYMRSGLETALGVSR